MIQVQAGRDARWRAFTLVEILIVVVILAILAVIVIPRFSNATDTARINSLLTHLHSLRKQMEVYRFDHDDEYPTVDQLWGNLTGQTATDGTAGTAHGPYTRKPPVNPFTLGTAVAADNSGDWQYDEATGRIKAVVPATLVTKHNLSTDDVVAAP